MVAYIFSTFQPCGDPQGCARARLDQQHMMGLALQQGNCLLRQILGYTPLSITAEDETVEQITQSGFSYREIVSVVKSRESRLIEWNEGARGLSDLPNVYTSTVFILARLTPGQRPLHVLCGFQSRPRRGRSWHLPIIGAYDPSELAYCERWASNYTERCCFCEPHREQDELESRMRAYASDPFQNTPYARNRRAYKDQLMHYTTGDAW